jgi:hypothetical protein
MANKAIWETMAIFLEFQHPLQELFHLFNFGFYEYRVIIIPLILIS